MDLEVLSSTALALAIDLLAAVAILVVGWIVANWLAGMVRRASERDPRIDRTLTTVFSRLVRWGVLAFTVVAVLARFGVQTASIIAVLGAAGLAVGLALQGALSNVAAGVMILTLRPFRLGDAVEIAGTVGSVEDIGLVATRLRTFDGVVVHQPNSNIWGSEIKNYSQAELRRFDVTVGVDYRNDLAEAFEVAHAVLAADERILTDPAPLVAVDTLGEDRVDLLVRVWATPDDWLQAKFDLARSLKERMDAAGLGVPLPQRDLHLVQDQPIEIRSIG